MSKVHQLGVSLTYGDAITNHILALHQRLTAWGYDARAYAEVVEPRLQPPGQPDSDYTAFLDNPDDLLIYHYSAYCANLQLFHRSRNRKILIYHNITPPDYFTDYDPALALACQLGRAALPQLRDADLALGVSEFNRQELVAVGFEPARTGVLPVLLDLASWETTPPNERLQARLSDGAVNVLCVGRISPNKAIEDVIKIFAAYRQANPRSRLTLVGSRLLPRYAAVLDQLVQRLGLGEYVTFAGRVELADLKAYYQTAHVLLCASRHEGFAVPLLEAMHFGVPILAYRAAAIPDTLGAAGVMFTQFDYSALAETLHLLATDAPLRAAIIAGQRARLAHFAPEQVETQLRHILASLTHMPLP